MRIIIETNEQSAAGTTFSALPGMSGGESDAGRPPDELVQTLSRAALSPVLPTEAATGATDAGGPPAWLVELVERAAAREAVGLGGDGQTVGSGDATDGGSAPA